MSGPRSVNLKGRLGAVAMAAVGGLLMFAGTPASAAAACGEEGAVPLITEASVTPGTLPAAGGTGTVETRVEDQCGVIVSVEIASTEGTFTSFELLPGEEDLNTHHRIYRGEFQVPENRGEAPVSYAVTIRATEPEGGSAELLAGQIEVAGVPPFDEPPFLFDPSIVRNVWGYRGGTSVIGVSAEDLGGISEARAVLTGPGGETEVALEPVAPERFEASVSFPANLGSSPAVYSVAVFAADDIGQTTGAYAGTVTVEPKGTPNPGFLTLEAPNRYFGSVALGHKAAPRTVRLVNPGKPGSPPVTGFLRSYDNQFYFPEGGLEGIPFSVGPGEEELIEVDFRPNEPGRQNGLLVLDRADGRQPNASLRMFGWGGRR
jgi:hypothetical protein